MVNIGQPATITIAASGAPSADVDMTITATPGVGVTITSSPVTLQTGASSKTFTFSSTTAGTYTLTATPATTGIVNPTIATVEVEVTALPTVTLTAAPTSVNAGQNSTITVAAVSAPRTNVTLDITASGTGGTIAPSSVTLTNTDFSKDVTFSSTTAGTYTLTATPTTTGIVDTTGATVEVEVTALPTLSLSQPSPDVTIGNMATVNLSTKVGVTTTLPTGPVVVNVIATPTGTGSTSSSNPVTKPATLTSGSGSVTFTTGPGAELLTGGDYTLSVTATTGAGLVTIPTITDTITVFTPTVTVAPTDMSKELDPLQIAIGDTDTTRTGITVSVDRAPSSPVTITVASVDIATPDKEVTLGSGATSVLVTFSSGSPSSDLPDPGDYVLTITLTSGSGLVNFIAPTASIQVLPVPAPDEPTAVDLGGNSAAISSVEFIGGYEMMVGVSAPGFLDTDVITLRVGIDPLNHITPTSLTFAQLRSGTRFIVQGENTQLTQAATHNIVARTTRTPLLTEDSAALALRVIVDVDENDNGLIELASAEMVNTMREDPTGASYDGISNGCPTMGGCIGYELIRDITLSGEWAPIGDDTTPFTAIFDGNDRTISGMDIPVSFVSAAAGFFGVIGSGGVVTSVRIEGDMNVSTSTTASGGLAGENQGTIRNSSADVDVRPNGSGSTGGGLVGRNAGTIDNSFATGDVRSTTIVTIGGLVGINDGGTIQTATPAVLYMTGLWLIQEREAGW